MAPEHPHHTTTGHACRTFKQVMPKCTPIASSPPPLPPSNGTETLGRTPITNHKVITPKLSWNLACLYTRKSLTQPLTPTHKCDASSVRCSHRPMPSPSGPPVRTPHQQQPQGATHLPPHRKIRISSLQSEVSVAQPDMPTFTRPLIMVRTSNSTILGATIRKASKKI